MKAVKVKNADSYVLTVSGDELENLINLCSGHYYSPVDGMKEEMERVQGA